MAALRGPRAYLSVGHPAASEGDNQARGTLGRHNSPL